MQVLQTLSIDGIEFFFRLAHLLFDELLRGRAGVDRAFRLLVDVAAGEFGRDRLRRFGITTAISDVEAVRDFVITRVRLDLDLLAHRIDQEFHRFAAAALVFV